MKQETAIETIKESTTIEKSVFGGTSFEMAQRQAKALSASELVPTQFRDNVPNCLLAMEIAHRIKASVFAVMSHLYVVNSRPAFDSTFLIATVNSANRFTPLKFRFEGASNTPTWGCRAYAIERESGEECVGPLVTLAMADREGWMSKKGSKWRTMPELMLHYRAAAWWTRVYSPELSLGMQTLDEVTDVEATVIREKPDTDQLTALTQRLQEKNAAPQEEPAPASLTLTQDATLSPVGEMWDIAREMWGDQDAPQKLQQFVKDAGYKFEKLSDDLVGRICDLLNERGIDDVKS